MFNDPWQHDGTRWRLVGMSIFSSGTSTLYMINMACLNVTGRDQPPLPVRCMIPVCDNDGGVTLRQPHWVKAYPIILNEMPFFVWMDSRGVLRFMERLNNAA